MANAIVAGWDIGGAHLKAALAVDGRVIKVMQIACPLWLGEDQLRMALAAAGTDYTAAPVHAITMTGELAEIFPARDTGVENIAAICEAVLRGEKLYFGVQHGMNFGGHDHAIRNWRSVASANWRAPAVLLASSMRDALFIDIGSTTTDIVLIRNNQLAASGETDFARLKTGELVYTGVMRTPLMALAARVPFQGVWQPVMAENFSVVADVYRLTGEIDPEDDLYPASDGRGKSENECIARLARMIGCDAGQADARAWRALAGYFRELQIRCIGDAVAQVLSSAPLPADAPLIGAGAGHFLVRIFADRLNRPYRDFSDLIPVSGAAHRLARTCAPAAAVALLAGCDFRA